MAVSESASQADTRSVYVIRITVEHRVSCVCLGVYLTVVTVQCVLWVVCSSVYCWCIVAGDVNE